MGQTGRYTQDTVDYEQDPPAVGSVSLLDRRGQRALLRGGGLYNRQDVLHRGDRPTIRRPRPNPR